MFFKILITKFRQLISFTADKLSNYNSYSNKFIYMQQGGPAHFFTKINFGFYLKARSANYKLVFIEFKNII